MNLMKKKIFKVLRWTAALFFGSTILSVVVLRFVPVFFTPLMFIRCGEQLLDGKSLTMHHHWVSIEKISPHLPVAVMGSEDQRFLLHHGFDFAAIQKAAKQNMRGGKKMGASTISQQTAKNVFLWPGRSWIRKGFGASNALWKCTSTLSRWATASMVRMLWLNITSVPQPSTLVALSVPLSPQHYPIRECLVLNILRLTCAKGNIR